MARGSDGSDAGGGGDATTMATTTAVAAAATATKKLLPGRRVDKFRCIVSGSSATPSYSLDGKIIWRSTSLIGDRRYRLREHVKLTPAAATL